MINKLLNIIKLMVAISLVIGLIAVGFSILLVLLLTALIAGAVYWLKQQSFLKGKETATRYTPEQTSGQGSAYTHSERITVIEGEAVDITSQEEAVIKRQHRN